MRLVGDSGRLAEAATFAARHTASASASPAVTGLRLSTAYDDGEAGLVLSGYDYEAASTITVPVEVREPGEVLLPGRTFAEIVRSLPPGPLELSTRGGGVDITAGPIEFALPTLPLEEYPTLPKVPEPAGGIEADPLARAAQHLAKVAMRDDVVPVMSATQLEFGADRLSLMSSDRYRIAIHELPWKPDADELPASALVPARLLAEAAKALDRGAVARLGFRDLEDGVLALSDDQRTTTMRLIDGNYPALRRKVPTEFTGTVTLPVEDLRAAIRRVCIVADRYSAVVLTIGSDEVEVGAAGDVDTFGRQRLASRLDGDGATVGFNAGYLLDGLDALSQPWVRLGFQEGLRPALMVGAESPDEVPEEPAVRYVSMPRRLTG